MTRSRAVLLALTAWTLVGFYFATQAYFNPAFRLRPQWGEAVAINLTYYYLWGLATPVVIWLARRFPPRQARTLLLHAGASLVLTFTQLVLAELILSTFTNATYRDQGFLYALKTALGVNFHSSLPTYWLILAIYLAWTYSRNAARLEAQLSRAQLDALKMQLNPHFLFNTLNSVSALMYSDVEAADAMLARLSEFLRLTIDRPIEPEIPLEQELDFIRRYLEIEHIRFEERLQVEIDVQPGAERALVPSLVLQPLVENAIHHGISKRAEGGSIEIHASRTGENLLIVVEDHGAVPAAVHERIGLSNCRARVEALRGEMTYGPTGDGFSVEITLPWSER
ncbi:MAG TPA: histidine kinase [Thermoanaerobaculia bacterium]|nr:histidine kinase [Thermoanaerobaculia bacterium]